MQLLKFVNTAFVVFKTAPHMMISLKNMGEPDSLNESLLLGTKTVTGLWYTGIKGKADGAFASLTFENGALTSKTQTDLK